MKKGWIKLYRREDEWLKEMSDQEFRYYLVVRVAVVWDKRNKLFGTFDARTKVVKEKLLPDWSSGKINTIKNKLIKRGYLKKHEDYRRLELINAEIFLEKTNKYEIIFQQPGINLHISERNIQSFEKEKKGIYKDKSDLAKKMSVSYSKDSEY